MHETFVRTPDFVVIDDPTTRVGRVMARSRSWDRYPSAGSAVIGRTCSSLGTSQRMHTKPLAVNAAKQTDGSSASASGEADGGRGAQGRMTREETYEVENRVEALVLMRRIVRRGDTVLVKGSHSLALDELADALVQSAAKA